MRGHTLLPFRRLDVQAPEPANRAVTRRTLPGVHLPFPYDQVSQLHSLAERIHNAADELPLTDSVHSGVDNLDDLDDSTRDIAGLITHRGSLRRAHRAPRSRP
ncbi:hypothetical protein [Streptomyces sp. NPDC087294]|uniref:hypothetical protein n=1 Tax=Streptomyces sp. NPDC087294 TaxID=3365777 RepID=UPI0037FEAE47